MDETRSSGYRDCEAALGHNRLIQARRLLPNEHRVDNTRQGVEETVSELLRVLEGADRLPQERGRPHRLPPVDHFASYL